MSWFIIDIEMVVQAYFIVLSLLMCADLNPFLVFSQTSEDVFKIPKNVLFSIAALINSPLCQSPFVYPHSNND